MDALHRNNTFLLISSQVQDNVQFSSNVMMITQKGIYYGQLSVDSHQILFVSLHNDFKKLGKY